MSSYPNLKKLLSVILAVAASWTSLSQSAGAFSTYRFLGGRVHKSIIEEALVPLGFTPKSLEIVVGGCEKQDDPRSPQYKRAECHAINNTVGPTFAYVKATILQSVEHAGGADSSELDRQKTLLKLGQALHALHDFYSHSNYLELMLAENVNLKPVNWEFPPAQIRTCYYHYAPIPHQEAFETRSEMVSALRRQYPELTFHTPQEYGVRELMNCPESTVISYAMAPVSFTHAELNKDNEKTLEGSTTSTRYGKSFFQLAKQLAKEDTVNAWWVFERAVRRRYGDRADRIILSLKLCESQKPQITTRGRK